MNRIVLGVVLISFLGLFSCKPKPVPPTPPVSVNLLTVTEQRVLYYDKYPATTQALSQVNILPEVQGYITGLSFVEGSTVRKGQVLYEIDKRLYESSYDAAVANLKVIQGNLTQAQQDADRYEYLNSQNAVAKQLYDHAVIALQNAKNQVQSAEEAVKTAKTNLSYSVITAPFDGTIGFSLVKLGNMVTVGQTILNTISTDDPMAVDFLINEKQLADFEMLEAGKKDAPDSLFTILLPNNSLYSYTGKISVIDRAVDAQTGSIRVRLVFPNQKHSLRAGMSCTVRVHNLEPAPVILIPGKAVVEQMGEYFVFIAKDTVIKTAADSTKKAEKAEKAETDSVQKGPRLVAFQKKVQLGQTIGGNVIVKDGISVGDSLIVDGVQLLHDGSKVTTGTGKQPGKEGGKEGGKKESADANSDSKAKGHKKE